MFATITNFTSRKFLDYNSVLLGSVNYWRCTLPLKWTKLIVICILVKYCENVILFTLFSIFIFYIVNGRLQINKVLVKNIPRCSQMSRNWYKMINFLLTMLIVHVPCTQASHSTFFSPHTHLYFQEIHCLIALAHVMYTITSRPWLSGWRKHKLSTFLYAWYYRKSLMQSKQDED